MIHSASPPLWDTGTKPACAGPRRFSLSQLPLLYDRRFLTPLASEMQAVAVAWQVYGLTHRPLDLGLVGLAQFLPGV
jgi:hypothetical protein